MALEDDLTTTINDIRRDFEGRADKRKDFNEKWKKLRGEELLPRFGRAIVVFKKLGWTADKSAPNGSAILRLGETRGDQFGAEEVWLYVLTIRPNLETEQIEINTVNGKKYCREIHDLTPDATDLIITEFAKLAEEDFQGKRLAAIH